MTDNLIPPSIPTELELEKWSFDKAFRDREIKAKEREQDTKSEELKLKQVELRASKWHNPLVVAVLATAVAATGNAIVSYTNAYSQRGLEVLKAEQARILEMLKTGDPDKAAENLRFLADAGLITDKELKKNVTDFLSTRKPGSGPTLPTAALTSPIVENARIYLLNGKKEKTNDITALRQELSTAGFAIVGARFLEDNSRPNHPEVRYYNPTDKEQSEKIAEFMRIRLNNKGLQASEYKDATARPGYIEIWLGR